MADKECMLRNCAHCGDYIDADEFEEGFDE